jgi:Asp-tRNA(Asn)/Glu-tRNA(Gln) amidotransferase A subunit family amidase
MIRPASLSAVCRQCRCNSATQQAYYERIKTRVKTSESVIEALVPDSSRFARVNQQRQEIHSIDSPYPPLYGVPIGVKDIFHAKGYATKANAEVPSEELTGAQGPIISRLRAAGAVILGKTVTAEFAHYDPGPTRNPINYEHTPGGSSSGSAAAVAAGYCPLSVGTQTIGSIIRPAAFCGIVGFKPSFNRLSNEGIITLSESADQTGYFTQNIESAIFAAEILFDEWRPIPRIKSPLRIGVPSQAYIQQADAVGLSHFENHVQTLDSTQHEIVQLDILGNISQINTRHERLVAAEAALSHHELYDQYAGDYSSVLSEMIESGQDVSVAERKQAQVSQRTLRRQITDVMKDNNLDILVSPAATGPPPEGIDSTGDPIMNLPWSHAGVPVITFPVSQTDTGLPLGLQCIAPFGHDEELLRMCEVVADAL